MLSSPNPKRLDEHMTFDEFLDSVLIEDKKCQFHLTVRGLVESYAYEFGTSQDEAVILDKLKELWPAK